MKRLITLWALLAPAVAIAVPVMPRAFIGVWVLAKHPCSPNTYLNQLTVTATTVDGGETGSRVTAVRIVSPVRVGVDSINSYGNEPEWTSTDLMTLSANEKILDVEQTRENGKRLAPQKPERYRRCS